MVFFLLEILMEFSVASDLGLHCLPMSHKKDARFIWVYIPPTAKVIWRRA